MARRLLLGLLLAATGGCALPDDLWRYIVLPEQRTIPYRDPAQVAPAEQHERCSHTRADYTRDAGSASIASIEQARFCSINVVSAS